MAEEKLPPPTEAELVILRILWRRGPSTVRDVCEELNRRRPTNYTTALKLLQVMHGKKLVRRDESELAHVYEAQLDEEETERQVARSFKRRLFEGSAAKLVMRILGDEETTPEEVEEIRKMLRKRRG